MASPAVPVPARPLRPVTPIGILAARLAAAQRLAEDPGTPAALRQELAGSAALAAGLEPYVEQVSSGESPALVELAARTRARRWETRGSEDGPELEAEMLSGHVEGLFLKFLVAMSGARRILEVGMFTGYSALAMAEAMGEGGELVACELDAEAARFAQDAFGDGPRADIDVRVGAARDTLAALAEAGESFELIFIDADKAGYRGYLDQILDGGLLAPGGTICVDNTLMQGQPWIPGDRTENGQAIADFNAAVAEDPRVEQVLVPLRDGVTLIRRVA